MLDQPSVKNLIPSIKEHGGLLEPILVRYDTHQVIEGNSRLAAFRHLYEKERDEKWSTILCNCVDKLTPKQQDAYLGQMHLAGKTPWTAYERANIFYVRNKQGVKIEEIAERFSTSVREARTRIDTIAKMKGNRDAEKTRFSYYDVLVRANKIKNAITPEVEKFVLQEIKKDRKTEEEKEKFFTAEELRDKLPDVLAKPKEAKKFVAGTTTLDEAYQNARPSDPQQKVRAAMGKLEGIERAEVLRLEAKDVNALLLDAKKLVKSAERIRNMVEKAKEKNA